MARAPQAARRLDEAMKRTRARLNAIVETAQSGRMAYDQMIGPNNPAGNKMVQDAIDALVAQTRAIEGVVAALHLNVRLKDSENFSNAGGR
jgi:putative iron-regulated protein